VSRPDAAEKGLRFGCGFLFGIIVGGIIAALQFYDDGQTAIAVAIVMGLVAAIASLKLGDAFWRAVSNVFWWF